MKLKRISEGSKKLLPPLINYAGIEFNIPNALVTEAIAACTGAMAAPAPGIILTKESTVASVDKTVASKVEASADIIFFL